MNTPALARRHTTGYCHFVPVMLQRAIVVALICASGKVAAKPQLDGVWQVAKPITQLRTADGKQPPLLPAAQKIYEARIAQMKAGDHSYDPTITGCKPMGEPRTGYDNWPFEIVQGDDRILLTYTWNRMVRFIDLQENFDPIPGPMYYGTSIARWDGESLVVSVKKFTADTLLDAAGMPHSDQLELIERFTLQNNGAVLEERITFKDPKVFSRPWNAVITYNKLPDARIAEDICLERQDITLKSPMKSLPKAAD